LKVAVIGAGAAGLVSARELIRRGHEAIVFEQSGQVGGIWVYQSETEDDLMGQSPSHAVFSSLYDSLRTNLPRDLMAFQDYTFDSKGGGDDHWQRYPHHTKVLIYLERFANDFGILPLIRFNEKVTGLVPAGIGWSLSTQLNQNEMFDAVMVCNGHYSKPRIPELPGIRGFNGLTMHSHNYRNPEIFEGKRVVVLGTASSGVDVAREVSEVAKSVYWCGDKFKFPPEDTSRGIHQFPSPLGFNGKNLEFPDDVIVSDIDIFVFCTGYEYQFPFLSADLVTVSDNWVHPLYMDLVSPKYPTLAFIGLPYLVIPFPLFDMQARWFSKVLTRDVVLPSRAEMDRVIREREADLVKQDTRPSHYHKLGAKQTAYIDHLAQQCGEPPTPDWFGRLALEAQQSRLADPEHFRDKPMQFHGPTVVKYLSAEQA
jgi:hypothetical protein